MCLFPSWLACWLHSAVLCVFQSKQQTLFSATNSTREREGSGALWEWATNQQMGDCNFQILMTKLSGLSLSLFFDVLLLREKEKDDFPASKERAKLRDFFPALKNIHGVHAHYKGGRKNVQCNGSTTATRASKLQIAQIRIPLFLRAISLARPMLIIRNSTQQYTAAAATAS